MLTTASVDVLSHVAIRAREQGVLLAMCDDPYMAGTLHMYQGFHGKTVTVSTDVSGEVGLRR